MKRSKQSLNLSAKVYSVYFCSKSKTRSQVIIVLLCFVCKNELHSKSSALNLYDIGDNIVDLQYDVPLDVFIKMGLTENFNNQSVASTSNYGYIVQSTFGWEL